MAKNKKPTHCMSGKIAMKKCVIFNSHYKFNFKKLKLI